jgi:hypothetical protein
MAAAIRSLPHVIGKVNPGFIDSGRSVHAAVPQ